ncbi:glycosyltransferase [Marinomonas sp. KJ51-3]|uniref:Glycosyltransferase n=1 Tax=Marinomonas rhodophyticola TaxID=2992803 RepID=A0ABT3KKC5_9GAMM|nr:glycosyltransferase [Marinomonas sp. KJ51-3]
MGAVKGNKKSSVFNMSDFFVSFSKEESFGITTIEAMLSKVLVFSTPVGILNDIGIDGVNYIRLDDKRVNNIFDCGFINEISMVYDEIVGSAYNIASDFLWEKNIKKINEIFFEYK